MRKFPEFGRRDPLVVSQVDVTPAHTVLDYFSF